METGKKLNVFPVPPMYPTFKNTCFSSSGSNKRTQSTSSTTPTISLLLQCVPALKSLPVVSVPFNRNEINKTKANYSCANTNGHTDMRTAAGIYRCTRTARLVWGVDNSITRLRAELLTLIVNHQNNDVSYR